jgi:hypothetical protein
MRVELDALLCQRYPEIFKDRWKDADESCMSRGFACGDGWFDLIDRLCDRLQRAADQGLMEQPVATQVKEKIGELRFRFRPRSDYGNSIVNDAINKSVNICIFCGDKGAKLLAPRSGVLPVCKLHATESEDFFERYRW